MKKLIALLMTLAVAVVAIAAPLAVTGYDQSERPTDVKVVTLFDNTADSEDTLTAGEIQLVGPVNIATSSGEPMYKGMYLWSTVITGTTPTVAIDYTFLRAGSVGDTNGVWTVLDTLAATGQNKYVSLDSISAPYMLFRVNNYDATASQIPNWVEIMFKRNYTYEKRR